MPSLGEPLQVLADRLRGLRTESWQGCNVTQKQLAQALSREEPISTPLISSWENRRAVPPYNRLEAYARFFATERSVAQQPFRLLTLSELAEHERTLRDDLLGELTKLRAAAIGTADSTTARRPDPVGDFWRFPADQRVTIVCSDPSRERLKAMPYADPRDPDHVELFRLSDLDALVELWGHIRAANPASQVDFRTVSETETDDYTTNLVLLGGVDFNRVTGDVLEKLDLPVRQLPREPQSKTGGFEVVVDGKPKVFRPVLREIDGREQLIEDIAHVYRGPNPSNNECTLTICNGMYGRGTLGAARVFTDATFRARNERYVRQRFASGDVFSIVTRVSIINSKVVTPDLTKPHARLHEWPEASP